MADAVTRPTRRVVPIHAIEPPASQALPRGRERLVGARTAWVHDVHGRLSEDGLVIPNGVKTCRQGGQSVGVGSRDTDASEPREVGAADRGVCRPGDATGLVPGQAGDAGPHPSGVSASEDHAGHGPNHGDGPGGGGP